MTTSGRTSPTCGWSSRCSASAGLALAASTDEGAIISAQAPSDSRAHVYVDTMGFAAPAVRLAVALLGADHVLVGSDWPIGERSASRDRVDRLLDDAGLDDDDARLVAGENARRLFGIDPRPSPLLERRDPRRGVLRGLSRRRGRSEQVRDRPAVEVVLGEELVGEALHRVHVAAGLGREERSAFTFSWLPE